MILLVAYLPGLAMCGIADLHAGEAKTDARDAAIIAEAACSMPHTLRSLRPADMQLAKLTILCGFDDDFTAQVNQTSNRIRGLLTHIHPALERVLGPRLDHPAVLDLLERYPSPAAVAATIVMPRLAQQLTALHKQRGEIAAAVERMVLAHPLWTVLTSMPGASVRAAAKLALDLARKAQADQESIA